MDLNTYNDFEETLLGLVRENYLRDIMKHTCRRAFDNIQIRGGAQPVFNPMTIFDDPNYVPPTDAACATADDIELNALEEAFA